MLHDEDEYPNPDAFIPERYLTKGGQLDPDAPNPENIAFGFGRRICPGRYFSSASVWFAIVSILAVFDITKAKDKNGSTIEPSAETTTGLVWYAPFSTPRQTDK